MAYYVYCINLKNTYKTCIFQSTTTFKTKETFFYNNVQLYNKLTEICVDKLVVKIEKN